MATVVVIVRLMPESPEENLNEIRKHAEHNLIKEGAKNLTFEEKPMAFGLKAIFAKFAFPEEKGTDIIESTLSSIKGVSSINIEDYRRAFG